MNNYFADSGYWIALITPGDEFHSLATEYDTLLESQNDRIVTTQLVLNETLAPRSGSSAGLRRAAIDLIDRITQDPRVSIIQQSPGQFDEAFAMFRTVANDKEWSITDCASFLLMQRLSITNALTGDHHFSQAGFTVLLRPART